MGLIGNGFRLNTGVHQPLGHFQTGMVPGANANYSRACFQRSQDGASTVNAGAAYPTGSNPPTSWFQPQLAGEMAMRAIASGSLAATLVPTKAMAVDLTGAGQLEATGALAIAMAIALSGSGTLTASILAQLNMSIDLTGSGDLDATLAAYGNMACDLLGAGDLDATIAAYGNMSIDIVVTGTGLTTANVGPAVWSAIAAANNLPGTMGEKLNDAGSAANPWTEVIEGGLTAADFMRLMMAVLQGNATGLEDGAIVYKGLDGTTTRIEATYVDGVRTITLRNGS